MWGIKQDRHPSLTIANRRSTWAIALIPAVIPGPSITTHPADKWKRWLKCLQNAISQFKCDAHLKYKKLIKLLNYLFKQYDCYFAPLEFNTVPYSWWNDKSGTAQYFWAGSNSTVHTCQCGIDGNCVDPGVNCNCDSAAPVQLTDYGK